MMIIWLTLHDRNGITKKRELGKTNVVNTSFEIFIVHTDIFDWKLFTFK